MSQKFVRIYKKLDINEIKQHLLIYGDLSAQCANCQAMDLKPSMRILDLGCGRAASSIFLAKEFGVSVWATDLWVSATENLQRIAKAGLDDRVFPVNADARSLPYADGFFDVVVCIDSYHYFGTDALYLGKTLAPLVKEGGQIGIVLPGLVQEILGPMSRGRYII